MERTASLKRGAAGSETQTVLECLRADPGRQRSSARQRLEGLLGSANGQPPTPPGKEIEDRYAALIAFVGRGPGAPIDNMLKLLNDLSNAACQTRGCACQKSCCRNRWRQRSRAIAAGRGQPRPATGGALATDHCQQLRSVSRSATMNKWAVEAEQVRPAVRTTSTGCGKDRA